MTEENTQEAAPTEQNEEIQALLSRIDALDRKNKELLDEKRQLKKVKETISGLPEGVDIQNLIDFKQKAEQTELERKGEYTEARKKLEDQFRESSAAKDKEIEELKTKVRELELVSPAVSTLADFVHDPNLVLNNYLPKEKIEVDENGPVVVDGYERTPIGEWAKAKLPDFILKQPRPQGGGAPAGRKGGGEIPAGMKNPFEAESFNITEQMRLYRTDKPLYEKLQAASKR